MSRIPTPTPRLGSPEPTGTLGRTATALARTTALTMAFALAAAPLAPAADEPARPQPTAEGAGTVRTHVQPTAIEFAPPNQPDVSASEAREIDELYRQVMSRSAPPSGWGMH